MGAFGYKMEKENYNPDADLPKINNNPRKFRNGIMPALLEHGSVIVLTVLLFITFSSYNRALGIIWLIFRTGEGLIQFINEPNYWGLLNIAREYANSNGAEKKSLSDLALTIFSKKDNRFKIAMICWSFGTLSFSIVLVTSGIVPEIVGWFGIASSIIVGFTTGIKLAKPKSKDFTAIGGLSAILFEVIIGVLLAYYSII